MIALRERHARTSTERHFRRWRRQYRRDIRATLAVTLGVALLLALLIRLFLPWHPGFVAGIYVGAALGLAVWLWDDPPEAIARWGRGAEGERRTAKALRSLERKGWRMFHDLAARRGNLDHVVVGPGGVFLLDSKNLTGRLVVEGGVLHTRFAYSPANDSAWTGLAPAVNGSAKHLQQRLQRELGWIVDVWPVVVLVSERFEQRRVTERRLTYVAVDALAEWLEEQPRRIADRDLPAVAAAVAAVPPADDVPFVPEPGEESFDTTAAVESQR